MALIPVRAGVLVPEAHHVPQLVHHDPKLVAVLPDGDGLGSVPPLADEGAAAAGPLCEHDPVGVLGRPLHKLDAGVVLPVPHRLLEQRLVHPAEIAVDLVWNHCKVPNPLRPASNKSTNNYLQFGPREKGKCCAPGCGCPFLSPALAGLLLLNFRLEEARRGGAGGVKRSGATAAGTAGPVVSHLVAGRAGCRLQCAHPAGHVKHSTPVRKKSNICKNILFRNLIINRNV